MRQNSPGISILTVICDQLNAGVLGTYGGPVPTPNLDRLADQAVVFDGATCPCPFCTPSRASLLTGLYPHAHGMVYNVMIGDYPAVAAGCPDTEEGLTEEDTTLDKLLHEDGYQTHHYGKWHLRGTELSYYPDMYGEHLEYEQEMAEVFAKVRERPRGDWMNWYGWACPVEVQEHIRESFRQAEQTGPYAGRLSSGIAEFVAKMGKLELPLEQVFDVRVVDKTVERLRAVEGPFSITCSFNYPHDPNVIPEPYYSMFDPAEIELPANFETREERFEDSWSRQIVNITGEAGAREFLRLYYGAVKLMDDQLGRVLDALAETGRAEDTIVVFTADHSDMAGGHGMVWKSLAAFYEELARVPLLIRFPQRIAPGRSDIPASLVDLMPTLLELTGHPVPGGVQGQSLAPFLTGQRPPEEARPCSFSERISSNPAKTRNVEPGVPASFMARGRRWKYIRYLDGDEYLYDLQSDPGETQNLVDDASALPHREQMRGELQNWLEQTDFAVPQEDAS